jgi:hypothetical protein
VQASAAAALLERQHIATEVAIELKSLRTATTAGTGQLDNSGDATRDRRSLDAVLTPTMRQRDDDLLEWQANRQWRAGE